jgi:hypothetical protein
MGELTRSFGHVVVDLKTAFRLICPSSTLPTWLLHLLVSLLLKKGGKVERGHTQDR